MQDGKNVERDGVVIWLKGVDRHRLNGPAYETPKGFKEWVYEGQCHRLKGPAIIWPDGDYVFALHGRYCNSQAVFEDRHWRRKALLNKLGEL
jgi:hypothetical protein